MLSQRPQFYISHIRTTFNGTESFKFFGTKIWELVADELKLLESFSWFRKSNKPVEAYILFLQIMQTIYTLFNSRFIDSKVS